MMACSLCRPDLHRADCQGCPDLPVPVRVATPVPRAPLVPALERRIAELEEELHTTRCELAEAQGQLERMGVRPGARWRREGDPGRGGL